MVIPMGINVCLGSVLGNKGEDEFCPYVLIPCFYNKTLSEMIAVVRRKRTKMQDCRLL